MRRRSVAVGVLAVSSVATPVAAQSVNRNLIDQLNLQLLYVALPLMLFVEVILVYAVFRFKDNENPEPTAEDPPLEITWTIATAIVLVFVGFSAYTVMANPYITPGQTVNPEGNASAAEAEGEGIPERAVEIETLAYQWGYQFTYPGANVTTQNLVVLPAERDVYFRLTSPDVIHALFVPKLGVKQDIFPGRTTTIRTKALQTGEYRAYCTEFCGDAHARMRANVVVVERDAYREWLAAHGDERNVTVGPGGNATAPPVANGSAPA